MLDAQKELAPVFYDETGVRINHYTFAKDVMCFPAHWHDRVELLQILSGRLDVYLDDEHIVAIPGQTVIIMPHMIHCGFPGEDGVSYNMIAFDPDKFRNATVAADKYLLPLVGHKVSFSSITNHPQIARTLEELVMYSSKCDEFNSLCTIGKIFELVGLLYRHCSTASKQPYKTDERFATVLEYINSHYTENISAKSISHIFGYDETYFCRRFKEATGITTMKYIRILRLELAQKLLRDRKMDIRSISSQCGFSDVSYFSNCFKQHFGFTPTEFRNNTLHIQK